MSSKEKLVAMARIYQNKNKEYMLLKAEHKDIKEKIEQLNKKLNTIEEQMQTIQYDDYAYKMLIDAVINLDDKE